jgi:sec-independent protein translocase protein TatB
MFDVSFSELMLIGVVALVVIGPERLPKVARTAGQWLGKLNRYVAQVKQDINRDIKLDELRKMQQDMKDTAQRYEILASQVGRQAEETAAHVEQAVLQETGQISKAMESLSSSEGGSALKELGRVQEQDVALVEALPEEPAALDGAVEPEAIAATDATVVAQAKPETKAA